MSASQPRMIVTSPGRIPVSRWSVRLCNEPHRQLEVLDLSRNLAVALAIDLGVFEEGRKQLADREVCFVVLCGGWNAAVAGEPLADDALVLGLAFLGLPGAEVEIAVVQSNRLA